MADSFTVMDPNWPAHLQQRIPEINMRMAKAVAADARLACPVDDGDLRDSIEPKQHGADARVHVGTDHWAPTEYGSLPHEIRSTGPWPLRNAKTGEVFGQVVQHPGTPAQPFMRPALYTKRSLRWGKAL